MVVDFIFIALALGLLFVGAEGLVRGSAAVATRAGLSPLVVGLTIVAFGTSSPELVVSVKAAVSQQGDIAVGNVVGSNIFNIAFILGLTALVCPIPVHRQIIKVDAPIALAAAILLVFLLMDKTLGRVEGALLVVGIIGYTLMNVMLAPKDGAATDASGAEPSIAVLPRCWMVDIVFILAGLVVLVIGSQLLVDHSVKLATYFGISEAVIGLTIVAAGTSMPELATSVVAAFRKQPDIAIGNVIGSNVFNILGILGVASVVTPISATGISTFDYATMIIFTVLLIPLLYTGRLLHRIEGAMLLLLYGAYVFVLWPK
ncbi:MAG: calcium/sodium antiporter [Gammaproteobacteria bacterium]|nr:calcium/sodium antiporter [Gammaproteobacteria bacterium]MBU1554810.1 calcium/sodium antiporter [Gammaproteobacteria bacterium]MBU2070270.1 calcium/sodium antiporter [Gammaproteobacteria bacterium]MBU2183973.1 calcium/sodium antiporter [Gammaproteobacteria bacterium]MBU2206777.1 calcium/sodium antiporter [Gammaproteobacteria bacterium]